MSGHVGDMHISKTLFLSDRFTDNERIAGLTDDDHASLSWGWIDALKYYSNIPLRRKPITLRDRLELGLGKLMEMN